MRMNWVARFAARRCSARGAGIAARLPQIAAVDEDEIGHVAHLLRIGRREDRVVEHERR